MCFEFYHSKFVDIPCYVKMYFNGRLKNELMHEEDKQQHKKVEPLSLEELLAKRKVEQEALTKVRRK